MFWVIFSYKRITLLTVLRKRRTSFRTFSLLGWNLHLISFLTFTRTVLSSKDVLNTFWSERKRKICHKTIFLLSFHIYSLFCYIDTSRLLCGRKNTSHERGERTRNSIRVKCFNETNWFWWKNFNINIEFCSESRSIEQKRIRTKLNIFIRQSVLFCPDYPFYWLNRLELIQSVQHTEPF